MRKLIFAAVLAVMGAFVFAAGSPAQAVPANTMSEVGKVASQSNVTEARWRHHRRYYRRYYYYRPHYRRYYHRHHWRRCNYFRRHGYLYRRCYYYY